MTDAASIPSPPTLPPGVVFTAPPPYLMPSIRDSMAQALASLPPDASGALVAVATDKGTNAAFVARVPGGFEVQAWIGKTWGHDVTYGAEIQKVFRW